MDFIQATTHGERTFKQRAVSAIAKLLAMPEGFRHRAELRELTPERRGDISMTERDHETALRMPVTDYPVFAIAYKKWERRILALLG
ncbi:hypothetical protein EI983_04000 [Roseovarius faecimaris]|uniref:Uncharacterized protein n=1 Tax=Roseovarius faecimaris TaxID=2494550 RepID=A0A6I6INU2_9RHOB|nr:hypothetical protein [Roseovarius faecimaris]QGX97483.1 hypothetical protein EI983_04000 [Roseovarius faecimaris]